MFKGISSKGVGGRRVLIGAWLLLSFFGCVFGQEVELENLKETRQMEYSFSFSEGLKSKMLGNPDQANTYFNRCIQLDSSRPAPYYELGKIAMVENKLELASQYLAEAMRLDPNNEWYQVIGAEIDVRQQNFEEGAIKYAALFEHYPAKMEYLGAEIDLLTKTGQYKTALKRIAVLEKLTGYGQHIGIRKKDIYLARDQTSKAIKELEKLIDTFPEEVELRGILAELYAEKGMDQKALDEFKDIKKMNSGNPIVYFSLGQYYMQKGEEDLALKEFKIGFASKQVNPEIKIQVLMELIRLRKEDEKLSDEMTGLLEVLYAADAGSPQVDAMFADYLYKNNRASEAEPIFKRIIKSDPANFMVWQNLLFIQNEQLDFREMFDIASEAVKVWPNQSLFFLFKGIGATQIQEYELAVKSLNTGLGLNNNNAELTKQFYVSLGDAQYKLGAYKEAFRNYDMLLLLDHENIVVLNNYSYYLSLLDQDLDKALTMITKCIEKEPENNTYQDTYAWVLFKMGDFNKALIWIEKAVGNDSSGEVWEHYGDILFRNELPDKAKTAWEKARNTGEASEDIDAKIKNGLEDEE